MQPQAHDNHTSHTTPDSGTLPVSTREAGIPELERVTVRHVIARGNDHAAAYELFGKMEELEREAFGYGDRDLAPAHVFDLTGLAFGIWKGESLAGYALCAYRRDEGDNSRFWIDLHQLGIASEFRRQGLASKFMGELKQFAAEGGPAIRGLIWWQDPLLAGVAGLYIGEVGGTGTALIDNKYGMLGGNYHGLPTHRLEVRIDNDSPRVLRDSAELYRGARDLISAANGSQAPVLDQAALQAAITAGAPALVVIPPDFAAIKKRDHSLAVAWQSAFVECAKRLFEAGYEIVDFQQGPGELARYLFIRR